MKLNEIKSQANKKVLLRGESGRGKTQTSVKVAITVSAAGHDVLYVDTETEGAETIATMVEAGEHTEDEIENIDYQQATNYDEFMDLIVEENHKDYDLMIVDTLDHKSTYAQMEEADAQKASDVEWSEWFGVYETEKDIMETLNKPRTNIIATLDPQSGSMDKEKGVQTNIHGYFNVVVELKKHGDEYTNRVRNFVGRGDVIGNELGGDKTLWENLSSMVLDRV